MSAPQETPAPCFLGFGRDNPGEPVRLEPASVLRHVMALGSSGSGKTVFAKVVTEEVARQGIPAICVDPQGDLCSLALAPDNFDALAERGIDVATARAFHERVEVVLWSPAAAIGIPLSADPIRSGVTDLPEPERSEAISGIATMIVALLGYDLAGDEGEGLVAVFDRALHERLAKSAFPRSLAEFSSWFTGLDERGLEPYARYLSTRKIEAAGRRLARMDVGARRRLFHEGLPLDIDLLLGRSEAAPPEDGRVRLSVIYLNSLRNQEDKEFLIAALAERLYSWMLRNPSAEPQALFYIDEVAPFVPPVRKPACKPALTQLFKQARKYGVGCLMATQNPGDVDYRAMAQFGTWALGRLTTRQDLKKVEPTIKSLAPTGTEAIVETLPRQKPGEFIPLSPDNFARPPRLRVRWLYTRHETLDEETITRLTDERHRTRFAALEAQRRPALAEAEAPALAPEDDFEEEDGEDDAAPESEATTEPESASPSAAAERTKEEDAALTLLRDTGVLSAKDFAAKLGASDSKARGLLRRLCDAGKARRFKEGRAHRYYASDAPIRPELDLFEPLATIAPRLTEHRAGQRAEALRRKKILGLFGRSERLRSIAMEWRLILRCPFEERVARGILPRLLGAGKDLLSDNLYLHPRTLDVLAFHSNDGLEIRSRPEGYASDIEDFDGQATFETRWPGELDLDEDEWRQRPTEDAVLQRFRERFDATPTAVECVALPTWKISFEDSSRDADRLLVIDALAGQPLPW